MPCCEEPQKAEARRPSVLLVCEFLPVNVQAYYTIVCTPGAWDERPSQAMTSAACCNKSDLIYLIFTCITPKTQLQEVTCWTLRCNGCHCRDTAIAALPHVVATVLVMVSCKTKPLPCVHNSVGSLGPI